MMDRYEIESKLYVVSPKYTIILKFLLNIGLFLMAVFVFFYIVMEGFSLIIICEFSVSVLVVEYYNSRVSANYQFSILNLSVENDRIIFVYNSIKMGTYRGPIQYVIKNNGINSIEYSKKLNALRFVGDITKTINDRLQTEKELVVYCKDEVYKLIDSIERNMNCTVIVLD